MSCSEEDYAATEYQATSYNDSDDEMVEEEAETEDKVDENGAGTSRIQGSMPPSTGISEAVLPLLQERWPSWKAAKGKKCQMIWRALVIQIRCLTENLTKEDTLWDRQLQVSEVPDVLGQ